jgi:hypothetical protein
MVEQKYISKFLKKGKSAEQEFAKLFNDTENATQQEDIHEHWDIKINYKVDVKGLRKISRGDSDVNENIHWIELKNVNSKLGWLYGSGPDYFAFELKKYWIIVEKFVLQQFVAKNVVKEYTEKPELLKLYNRAGRKDCLTMVSSYDLIYIAECMIPKSVGNEVENITNNINNN